MTKMPNLLYHYCSNEAFTSIISNCEIWLTNLSRHSNDPTEGTQGRTGLQKQLVKEKIRKTQQTKILEQFDKYTENLPIFAFCLSEGQEKLSQWRGYGANGSGVAIGFSTKFFDNIGDTNVLDKMKYDEQKIQDEILEYFDQYEGFRELINAGVLATDAEIRKVKKEGHYREIEKAKMNMSIKLMRCITSSLFFKNKHYIEENEWRIINSELMSNILLKKKHHGSKLRLHPIENKSSLIFPLGFETAKTLNRNEIISSVILGPKNHSVKSEIEYFLHISGFDKTKVIKSDIPYK